MEKQDYISDSFCGEIYTIIFHGMLEILMAVNFVLTVHSLL